MVWAVAILIPVLSGYIFAELFPPSSYFSAREEGHRLYFRAVFYGTFLVTCAVLLESILNNFFPSAFLQISDFIKYLTASCFGGEKLISSFIVKIITINGICLFLSFFFGYISNMSSRFNLYIQDKAIEYDDVEIIITRAVRYAMPISVTCKGGKVYVGFIEKAIDPREKRKDIRILPLLSGYREKENKKIIFTTNYESIYESEDGDLDHLILSDFEISLPLLEVQSINLFDLIAYNKFNK